MTSNLFVLVKFFCFFTFFFEEIVYKNGHSADACLLIPIPGIAGS